MNGTMATASVQSKRETRQRFRESHHAPMRHSLAVDQLAAEIEFHLQRTPLALAERGGREVLCIPHHHDIPWSNPNRKLNAATPFHEETTTLLISYLIGRFQPRVMIDAGSAQGHLTRVAASRIGQAPHVYALDMRDDLMAVMKATIARDRFRDNITPVHACLTDRQAGEREVWYARSLAFEHEPAPQEYLEPLLLRILNRLRGRSGRGLKSARMLLTSIDHFSAERGIRPDLIKMDVEGYEGKVLDGARRTLEHDRPMVLIELHRDVKQRFGETRAAVVGRMFDLGYRAIFLTDHHDRIACRAVVAERDCPLFRRQETDLVLFVPK